MPALVKNVSFIHAQNAKRVCYSGRIQQAG
jgi:hypothetical protein